MSAGKCRKRAKPDTGRLMILGAGVYQVPLIERARSMGMETVVVSIPGDYPGISLADHYVPISTTDSEGVIEAAKAWNIAAICTGGTDVGVPTLAYVAEALSLPGVPVRVARTISSKALFRQFLRDHGLPCPRFAAGKAFTSIADDLAAWDTPIVFKPEDSSGSRGVSILNAWNKDEAAKLFAHAQSFSRSGLVCAESFLEGTEVGGDGFMREGRLAFSTVTHKHMEGLVVRGHSLPTNIPPKQEENVARVVEQACIKLGYLNGPVNFDVISNPDEAVIIEMGARSGGNGIADLIALSTGVDLCTAVLEFATGQPVSLFAGASPRGYGTVVFGSPRAGVFRGSTSLEELRRCVPQVCRMTLAVPHGTHVEPLVHNANLIGYIVFECSEPKRYPAIASAALEALNLEVEFDGDT